MDKVDLTDTEWIKSSRSNGQSACVEAAFLGNGVVPVRDSKGLQGPVLIFGADTWSSFVAEVREGDFSSTD
ncbi:DUF397 domain-containing protein [Streptomyces sp. NPDC056672]|uniref:DUF397 domain-containing protein n=1 Tax=Streptomyces sp. NPDC056672 TaxID=3345906 RepID=UPI0036B737A9